MLSGVLLVKTHSTWEYCPSLLVPPGRTQDPTPNIHAENPNAGGRPHTHRKARRARHPTHRPLSAVAWQLPKQTCQSTRRISHEIKSLPQKRKASIFLSSSKIGSLILAEALAPTPRGRSDHRRGGEGGARDRNRRPAGERLAEGSRKVT